MLIVGTTAHMEDLDRSYTYAEDVSVTALAVGSFTGGVGKFVPSEPPARCGAFSIGSASCNSRSSTSHRWCACRQRPHRAWPSRREEAS